MATSRRNSRAVPTNTGSAIGSVRMLTGMLRVTSSGSATSGGRRSPIASTSIDRSTARPQAISSAWVCVGLTSTGAE